jgi:hypothetical protein
MACDGHHVLNSSAAHLETGAVGYCPQGLQTGACPGAGVRDGARNRCNSTACRALGRWGSGARSRTGGPTSVQQRHSAGGALELHRPNDYLLNQAIDLSHLNNAPSTWQRRQLRRRLSTPAAVGYDPSLAVVVGHWFPKTAPSGSSCQSLTGRVSRQRSRCSALSHRPNSTTHGPTALTVLLLRSWQS